RLWTVINEVISVYRAQGIDHGDLLSMLLAAQDDQAGGMSDREVRDEAVTLMGAGTETSSNSLSWLFHELDRHPEIGDRVRAVGGPTLRCHGMPSFRSVWARGGASGMCSPAPRCW